MEKIAGEQTAVKLTESAHAHYRKGDFNTAIGLYQQALEVALQKSQKIALHSNKAACYLKLKDVGKVVEECNAVLAMEPKQATILLLRAQSLEALRNIPAALADTQVLLNSNPSHATYTALHARLMTKLEKSGDQESRQASGNAGKSNDVCPSAGEAPPQPAAAGLSSEEKVTLVSRKANNASVRATGSTAKKGGGAAWITPDKENNRGSLKQEVPDLPESSAWQTIPKPKGHSLVDYRRWDSIGQDLSDDEENETSTQGKNIFRLKNLKILPVDKKGEK
eukprot:TRINITY_DN2065_c2_g4_i2.p1 TRINITY_DN2065_c2_g4~~TRINITY_DN2065_c2_g4_i2.p1  ORF type:complete len:325 (-),score=71.80 TRINITY_DN2065_c2_g4_i2:344-1183(-)